MRKFAINDVLAIDIVIDDQIIRIKQARVRAVIENEIYLDLDGCTFYPQNLDDNSVLCGKDVYYDPVIRKLCGTFVSNLKIEEIPARLVDEDEQKMKKWRETPLPFPPPLAHEYPAQ